MPTPSDKIKVCEEDKPVTVNKVETKKSDPIDDCIKANPNDNAFCTMPDWKSCAPKDNTKTSGLKLDDSEKKDVKKKLDSVVIFCILNHPEP